MIKSMKRLGFAGIVLAGAACAAETAWQGNLDEALKKAAAGGKLVLVEFQGADAWSARLNKELKTDEAGKLLEQFVPVRLDLAQNAEAAKKYGVKESPTMVVLDAQGQKKGEIKGYRTADALAMDIEQILKPQPAAAPQPGAKPPKPGAPQQPPSDPNNPDNPMNPIAQKMEEVKGKHLDAGETGPITQKKIDDILNDIDKLIEEASKAGGSGSGSGSSSGSSGANPSSPMQNEQATDKGSGTGRLADIFKGTGQVWGDKIQRDPEKEALKLRNDKFPPEYEELLKNYFSKLNQQADK